MIKLLSLLAFSFTIIACLEPRTHYYNITVPNEYSGFLIVETECENGVSAKDSVSIRLKFDKNGYTCLQEDYKSLLATRLRIKTVQYNRLIVPSDRESREKYGIGLVYDRIFFSGTGDSIKTFIVFWMGAMDEYNRLKHSDEVEALIQSDISKIKNLTPKGNNNSCKLHGDYGTLLDIINDTKLLVDHRSSPKLTYTSELNRHDSSLTDTTFSYSTEALSFKILKNSMKAVLLSTNLSAIEHSSYIYKEKLLLETPPTGCIKVKHPDGDNFYKAHYKNSELTRIEIGGVEID